MHASYPLPLLSPIFLGRRPYCLRRLRLRFRTASKTPEAPRKDVHLGRF